MNFLGIIACIFILFAAASAEPVDKEKLKEAARTLVMECKSKVGASDADVEALKLRKMPETQEGLCMLECIFDTSKIMKDGKFSKDGMVEGFKPVIGDDATKLKNLEGLAATCEKEIGSGDTDKCKTAKLLVECIMKNGKSHGFEIPPPHE